MARNSCLAASVFFLLLGGSEPAAGQARSERQRQYLAMAESTLGRPVTPDELGKAVLSPDGVASIRALFERSVDEALAASGRIVVPELGGESMLHEGRLGLVVYPDPLHELVRDMAALRAEPSRLLELLQASPDGRSLLKSTGGLHALLWRLANDERSAGPAPEPRADERARRLLEDVIDGAIATHFRTWTADPLTQAAGIESTEWRGRYAGFWHLHPPRLTRAGGSTEGEAMELGEGIEPSYQDMTNAVELGQFLTFVFQPEGFDAYDLSRLARAGRADLSLAVVTRHRAPGWRRHFLALVHRGHDDSLR